MSETELPIKTVDRRKVKKTLLLCYVVSALVATALSFGIWGLIPALATLGSILCLALGFWITEMLIGVFTQTIRANPTAIALLFTGKLGWWAALIMAARHMPHGFEGPVGLGMSAFLLAVVIAMIQHYGMPRISDGNPPRAP